MTRLTRGVALAAAVLLSSASLAACAPAVAWPGASLFPGQSSCPDGFIDSVAAAVVGEEVGITFSEVGPEALTPASLRQFFPRGCFMAFSGELAPGSRIEGLYAFAVTPVDETALENAILADGFSPDSVGWTRTGSAKNEQWEILAQSAADVSGDGGLVDLEASFPEATYLLASFHTTLDSAAVQ